MNADQHPRAGDDPFGDRVPQADVEQVARADVADCREAGLDRSPGVNGREDRLLRELPAHPIDEPLVEVGRPLVGQVGVSIDEAGTEGGVAQVDHGRALGDGQPAPTALMALPRRSRSRPRSERRTCRRTIGRP